MKQLFDTGAFPRKKQLFRGRSRIVISWHRFYDPDTGRYISADPIGLAGGMNLYAYVQNNPVNWVDPWGLKDYEGGIYDLFKPGKFPTTYFTDQQQEERDRKWLEEGRIRRAEKRRLTSCMSKCMGPYLLNYAAKEAIEALLITGYVAAGGGSPAIIAGMSYYGWVDTSLDANEILEKIEECYRCQCENQ